MERREGSGERKQIWKLLGGEKEVWRRGYIEEMKWLVSPWACM